MSTNEQSTPLDAAPGDAAPQTDDSPRDDTERSRDTASNGEPADAHNALSPAVRRLVRQFDLDVTGIHGTGPAGRIRVGDVMGLLGGRTDTGNRDAPTRPPLPPDAADAADTADDLDAGPELASPRIAAVHAASPTTTVFDCDLSRVLAHRKKLRLEEVELLTTSYFLTAFAAALDATPEITAGHAPCFGVSLTTTDGDLRLSLVDTAAVSWDTALEERVRAVDGALRANLDTELGTANLLVHHYGESGSVLATPTPIGLGHAASIGIGRARREIVVRTVDGVEAPRMTARCYLSLSFLADRVSFEHANRVMASAVRVLEQWPD